MESEKKHAAARSLDFIEDGMAVGLGTGSTAAYAVRLLGERVRAGLAVTAVATSRATEALARECGIPLTSLEDVTRLDITIDGADEVDGELRLIKGGGGALLREKIVAAASDRFVVVVDSGKLVARLGAFDLPVEVVPFAWRVVAEKIEATGCLPALRAGDANKPFVTDEGNYILDCAYGAIEEPEALARRLDGTTGIVDHGLFLDMADTVVVGRGDSVEIIARDALAR